MLSEFVEKIESMIEESTRIVGCPGDSTKSLIFVPGEQPTERDHAFPPRGHEVSNLSSLQYCVSNYASDGSVIWVSFQQVEAVHDDDAYRRNTTRLPLAQSPIFLLLANFGSVSDPKKLVRFLKHDCSVATTSPADLDVLISDLKFRTEDELHRQTTKQSDTMGQSIRSQVTGAEKIPDLVTFRFLPWPSIEEDFQQEVEVPCQLYIDPSERTISLTPLPGMIDAAKVEATSNLASKIREQWNTLELAVLCGTP